MRPGIPDVLLDWRHKGWVVLSWFSDVNSLHFLYILFVCSERRNWWAQRLWRGSMLVPRKSEWLLGWLVAGREIDRRIVESSCDVVDLWLGGSGQFPSFIWFSFCSWSSRLASRILAQKQFGSLGKLWVLQKWQRSAVPSCIGLLCLTTPQSAFMCQDAISMKSATERTIKVDITVDLVKEHLAKVFLKLKPTSHAVT